MVRFIQPGPKASIAQELSIVTSKALVKRLIPPRSASSRKGDNGTVLVAGGSRYYHGAPTLASMAALRTGADLVYTAVPRSITTEVRCHSPALIALPLPDDKLTVGSAGRLSAMLPKKCDSAAIGMGMSIARPEAIVALVRKLREAETRLLLDASALVPEVLEEVKGTGCVVTPHAGEFKRLFGVSPGDGEDQRIKTASEMARKHDVTILLKGPSDVICDQSRVGLNRIHNSAMTVGGTGDVLSGVVAGLLAKKMSPFDAALAGAYVNGAAGNLAFAKVGLHMIATDLVDFMAEAFKPFDVIKSQ